MANDKIHLAYVVHTLNPGGTERLVVEMSKALAEDFFVTVICLDEPGLWARELRRDGIPVHSLWRQPGLDLSVSMRLAKYCRENNVQIIHAHQCTPWFYAAVSRLWNSTPQVLLEEHGRFFPEVDNRLRRWVNKLLIAKLTQRFVAVSADIRKRLVRFEGLDADKIEVIYNGIQDFPMLSPGQRGEMRRDLGYEDQHFVVGSVGRFDSIKNFPMFVRSCASVMRDVKNLRVLLAGDGPEFSAISGLAESLGVSDRIQLTGFRDDARNLVQCLDLFVLSSFSEGTSMALLEAMAAGVPVVVTDVGGNPEIVDAAHSGWVIPSGDDDALSAAIRAAIDKPAQAQEYALAGRERIRRDFSFEGMLGRYRRVYEQMLTPRAA